MLPTEIILPWLRDTLVHQPQATDTSIFSMVTENLIMTSGAFLDIMWA